MMSRIESRKDVSPAARGVRAAAGASPLARFLSRPHGFPAALALEVLQAFSRPGDGVLDPFCGAGSPWMAAALSGRRVLAVARDKAALMETRALWRPPDLRKAAKRLRDLRNDMFYGDCASAPAAIQRALLPSTLSQFIHLRDHLDHDQATDACIMAVAERVIRREAAGSDKGANDRNSMRSGAPDGVFQTLQELLNRLLARRPPALAAERIYFARDGRLSAALMNTLGGQDIRLILGAAPAAREWPPDSAETAAYWLLHEDGKADHQRRRQRSDAPGLLEFLAQETGGFHEILAPGGICALWMRDRVLKGRPARTLAMTERLWRLLREQGASFQRVDFIAPETRATQAPSGRLLVLRKQPRGAVPA